MEKSEKSYLEINSCNKGLKVERLSRRYKRFQLQDISFEIPPGNILGLLGRNGAGKTTTIKMLAGCIRNSSGNIWINGVNMRKNPVLAQSQIGFMLDESMFLETKSLWENGLAFGRFYPEFTEEEWKKWLSVCGLQKSDWVGQLSKGQRMKFQFAFAMAHHSRIFLLDEPTGNLDPVFRKEFLDILQEIVEEKQISVLFSSHLTSDLEKVADRIALLEQGELLYENSMDHLLERYCLIKGGPEEGRKLKAGNYPEILGIQVSRVGFEAMLDKEKLSRNQKEGGSGILSGCLEEMGSRILYEETDLSKWMYYMTKGGRYYGQEYVA